MSREYVLVPKHKYEKMIESFQESQDSSINPPIQSEERVNNEHTGEGTTVGKSQSSFPGENANESHSLLPSGNNETKTSNKPPSQFC